MCTVLKMNSEEGFWFGKNNDSFFKEGILFTNKRELKKSALIMPPNVPLQWVSKYGSISFSQCGKELPVGGMNEVGLVVEQTTLPDTIYPKPSGLMGIGEIQLIQFILDTCANVKQAVQMFEKVEICQPSWTLHYALIDRLGEMAVIEYLDGKQTIFTGKGLTENVLSNSPYEKAVNLYNTRKTDLESETDYEKNSLERFMKAADLLRSTDTFAIDSAFITLEMLKRPDTVWNIVYHPIKSQIYFRTNDDRNYLKCVDLQKIDFEQTAPALMFPLSYPANGDITDNLMEYSTETNGDLVKMFFKNDVLASIMNFDAPDELLSYLTIYPLLIEEAK